jgi:hypothetical protein
MKMETSKKLKEEIEEFNNELRLGIAVSGRGAQGLR